MSLDEIEDALLVAGVHDGFPVERRALAGSLLADGVGPADVDLLCAHVRDTVDGVPAANRVLAALLSNPNERKARLVDLRRCAAIRARTGERAFGDAYAVPAPLPQEDRGQWEQDRRCRVAYCRAVSDRVDLAAVAAEIGVSIEDLAVMIERGRVLQRGRDVAAAPAAPDDQDQDARRKRFVESMRQRKA